MVVTVAGPDGCAFVHPARTAVTIRIHAQRRGKDELFICFHRLPALSGAPEISCDDDKNSKKRTFSSDQKRSFPISIRGIMRQSMNPVLLFTSQSRLLINTGEIFCESYDATPRYSSTAVSHDGRTTNFPLISTSTSRFLHDGTPMLYCSETKRFRQHTDSPAPEVPPWNTNRCSSPRKHSA